MALIKCKECGKEISDSSSECIHCGAPVSISLKKSDNIGVKQKKRNARLTIIIIICLLILFVVILGIPFLNSKRNNSLSSRMLNGEYSAPDLKDNTMKVVFKFKVDGTVDYQLCNIKTDDCTIESYTYNKYGTNLTIYYSNDVIVYTCSLEDSDNILRCYDREDNYQDYVRMN